MYYGIKNGHIATGILLYKYIDYVYIQEGSDDDDEGTDNILQHFYLLSLLI